MKVPYYSDLKDKTVVITGAAGVICGAIAKQLAHQGSKVALLDLNYEKSQELAAKITKDGGQAMAIPANVLDATNLTSAKERVYTSFGKCDILINGAGGNNPKATTGHSFLDPKVLISGESKTFFDLDEVGFKLVFDLNFFGTVLPTQIFAKDMAEGKQGVILNISSMNAFRPLTKIPAYSGAKAAISNFTQWLSVYLSKAGIRVNAIAPGFFLTEQNRTLLTQEDGGLTDRGKEILGHTPLGRFGEVDDLMGTVLWLISNQSEFVTGVVVPIDGGFSAYSGI